MTLDKSLRGDAKLRRLYMRAQLKLAAQQFELNHDESLRILALFYTGLREYTMLYGYYRLGKVWDMWDATFGDAE